MFLVLALLVFSVLVGCSLLIVMVGFFFGRWGLSSVSRELWVFPVRVGVFLGFFRVLLGCFGCRGARLWVILALLCFSCWLRRCRVSSWTVFGCGVGLSGIFWASSVMW
ncbi:hypothetical protein [Klebsiella michiganensis]|uniref:hypothetical protein n=1 Tax=Klebsiella michiganensis TaxID=1134687 RepID=UPI00111E7C7D|nr:hypothetical protein [Klebsiella michiganensis]